MTGARDATNCMVCGAEDHSIVALIALKIINSLLEMMIIQVNDEHRFSDGKQFRAFTPPVSLYGESDLFNIILLRWSMVTKDDATDSNGDAHDLVMK